MSDRPHCSPAVAGTIPLLFLAVVPTAVVLVSGCGPAGPPIATVSGTVTFEGKPVERGVVNFAEPAGFAISVPLETGGRFELQSHHGNGIPLATYKVSISPARIPDSEIREALAMGIAPPELPDPKDIPLPYREFDTSGFTAEVTAGGPNEFTFAMQAKGATPVKE